MPWYFWPSLVALIALIAFYFWNKKRQT